MRILHTADLHLGRQFNGIALDGDQDVILDQIFGAVSEKRADVLIIAGDVFDRAAPPSSAIRQFNRFMTRISRDTAAAVVVIAGNHDSGDRIGAMAVLTDGTRSLVRGVVSADEPVLVLTDEHGPVAFSALPFSYEYAARECFGDEEITTPEHVLVAQLTAARRGVPIGARWVVVSHAFVAGARTSDVERPLARVGGIETVSPEVFAGAHYVALGHLHRPQHVGAEHIRYSGSPLAFGFDETDHEKSMSFVEMDGAGHIWIEAIPFKPPRGVRVLRGKHSELVVGKPSTDFIKAILTDDIPLIEPMKRLREVFPHACHLSYARDEQVPGAKEVVASAARATAPTDVVDAFLEQISGEGTTEAEQSLVSAVLHGMQVEGDAA
ncbi:exonuclease SbcCD subunit D [Rhizobium leguminosarum]|uniref:Nuclease SbcCD subunit D n=1 Tax=Rhizobium leguminosarum TaxID=384 RepID=A0A2K9ZG04_RHILE|nr:exonuclease SbcCD subunit D [Rhizobium leguminosarum]AUW47164.1 Nuclease SbcCD subunit D [Rhizobium leguminosarum]